MINKTISSTLAIVLTLSLGVSSAHADDNDPWIGIGAAVGALYVEPDVDSPVLGADVDHDVLPTLSLYIYPSERLISALGWTKYLRVSTELGVTTHDVNVGGAKVGEVSTVPLNGNFEIHPFPDNKFDPFVGAGFNVTLFTDQEATVGALKFDRQPAGALFTLGANYWVTKNLFLEARARKLFIETDVVDQFGLVTGTAGAKIESLEVDPWTAGFSVGYRF